MLIIHNLFNITLG